jgi:hypothetical protein
MGEDDFELAAEDEDIVAGVEHLLQQALATEREKAPRCAVCGKPATCLGRYEGHGPWQWACDDCCGHGNEDGECRPVADVAEWMTQAQSALAAEREKADGFKQCADELEANYIFTRDERDAANERAKRAEADAKRLTALLEKDINVKALAKEIGEDVLGVIDRLGLEEARLEMDQLNCTVSRLTARAEAAEAEVKRLRVLHEGDWYEEHGGEPIDLVSDKERAEAAEAKLETALQQRGDAIDAKFVAEAENAELRGEVERLREAWRKEGNELKAMVVARQDRLSQCEVEAEFVLGLLQQLDPEDEVIDIVAAARGALAAARGEAKG